MNADGPTALHASRDKFSSISPKCDDQPCPAAIALDEGGTYRRLDQIWTIDPMPSGPMCDRRWIGVMRAEARKNAEAGR